ncbi:hypothetical protein [Hymenobacter seoulensis]
MTDNLNSKTHLQNESGEVKSSDMEADLRLTETDNSKTSAQIVLPQSLTDSKVKSKGGRPAKGGNAPVTWSVRGVERDTRAVLEKAAERAGKTMGQYMNDEVRAYAQSQITQSQLPASPKDLQVQVEQLTQLVEGIAARMAEPARKGFWHRIFGS